MYREQLLKNMDKIFYKLEIYDKKKQLMGLDQEEQDRFCSLFVDYLELKMKLWDDVFNEYILSEIMDEEAIKIKDYLYKSIKWNCELLITKQEKLNIKKEFQSSANQEKIIENIKKLYKILNQNLLIYKEEYTDSDFFEEVSLLLSNDSNSDFSIITQFLKYKFDKLYSIINFKEE